MTPTNRPITSREYKLLLNTERFRNRIEGARLFWRMLAFKVKKHDIKFEEDVIPPPAHGHQGRQTSRILSQGDQSWIVSQIANRRL
jgi:hypothetical protein